ncbi:MAG: hypothetical protein M0D55_03270 [Elusimicrobiota bacterium]|nr:MAG: hypothetical protein M0D55_03270 [Elusimicrobiota bacterium]
MKRPWLLAAIGLFGLSLLAGARLERLRPNRFPRSPSCAAGRSPSRTRRSRRRASALPRPTWRGSSSCSTRPEACPSCPTAPDIPTSTWAGSACA